MVPRYEDLLVWCMRLGVVAEPDGEALIRAAGADEKAARRALRRARAATRARLRDLPPRWPRAGSRPPTCSTSCATPSAAALADRAPLTRGRGAMRGWTLAPTPRARPTPSFPITHAAVELLTSGPLDHLKVCGNCRWLFLDQSRNHSRRWCSMDECGTQMKHAPLRGAPPPGGLLRVGPDTRVGADGTSLVPIRLRRKRCLVRVAEGAGFATCGSCKPSLCSCPNDCERPPGPLGPEPSNGAVGSSLSPEKEHQDLP